ncbi:hypothetical protein [Flavobacterium cerinum]|uniref:DUF4352 domain-containing protein n=1 Tax=Flavobacterium cerinum TaxID=2502784 RepID=A0ABY5INS6_9FLAO|nr:hypothetical protein [Flavobacterium cerinum]UUC44455.1 hypothetical protein NOX80_12530 [Flavobacterium cerinum]
MKKISILILASALTLTSCKKEQTQEQTEEPTTETPTAIVRPEPKTTVSGTSFIDESVNNYDKQFQTGSHTKEKYTVVSYTTNAKFAETDIDYRAPTKDQQLLAVNIGLESLLCDGSFSRMNTSLSIHIDDKAEKIQRFSSFTPEFYKANPNAVNIDTNNNNLVLKKGEKAERVFYFVIPKDADLSKAYLTLYRGSDREELKVSLNP